MAEKTSKKPVLLSGGNPQIPKGYGAAPVNAYLDAMPGWKQRVGRTLDGIVAKAAPGVRKAVKWNSPFYAAPDAPPDHWFMSFHCFDRYVKVTFFQGASLEPPPAETSKYPQVRYFHVREDDGIDEAGFPDWVRQAAALPGEKL